MRCVITFLLLLIAFNIHSQKKIDVIRVRKVVKEKCSATLLGKTGGKITKNELLACHAIQVSGPCEYKVASFVFSCAISGRLIEVACDSFMNWNVQILLLNLKPNDAFFIEKIKVKSNYSERLIYLPSLKFKVIK